MKVYRNEDWDLIENFFIAFNITFVPREYNETTDSLALAVAYFKVPKVTHLKYPIDVRYMPFVKDDIKHWKVFHDDQEIKEFLELVGEFSNDLVDQERDFELMENGPCINDSIADHKIVELKGNFIPKGLLPLERLFSKDDTLLKPTLHTTEENIIYYNIGSEYEPKMIRMSKSLSEKEKKKYISLLKEFVDIFAWSYQDLRTYDTSIIQNKIPLKPNTKPFKQKLRRLNPALLPVIEKEVKKLLDAKIIAHL